MSKRKQYIINKKFQLKTTFYYTGIMTLLLAIIIMAIGYNVINNNNKIDTILKDQDGIVHSLTYRLLGTKNQADKDGIKQISQSHNNNLQALDGIIKYNRFLIIILLGLVILNAALLSFFLIRKTHKISGPIYVMTGYLNEIREGRKPLFRQIREKDEFKDFYKLFVETMEKLLNKK